MKPILFSTPMVRAILEGRKTQTRRVVKEPFQSWMSGATNPEWWNGIEKECPDYKKDDILWVRETWTTEHKYPCAIDEPNRSVLKYIYKADKRPHIINLIKWKSSIFMPKAAARIFLKVDNIRVERLHELVKDENFADLEAEGISKWPFIYYTDDGKDFDTEEYQQAFIDLWNSINGKKYPWKSNPWVWVIEFERIDKPQ